MVATRPLEIGMNLLFVYPEMGGIRNSGPSLCRAVLDRAREVTDHRFKLFLTPAGAEYLFGRPEFDASVRALGSRCEVEVVGLDPRRKLRRLIYEQARFHRVLRDVHLLHSFDYGMPYLSRCRNVVMVRDLNYLNFGATFTLSQRCIRRFIVPLSLKLADRVVTISQSAKKEIVERFGLSAERVAVVYNSFCPMTRVASDDARDALRPGAVRPFVLAVGTLKLHKNYERLLEAFALLADRGTDLVIVGRDDGRSALLRERAVRLGIGARVSVLGFVEEERLARLYREASVFAFPSLYEGFGMPLLEAMAHRIPVACSDLEVFREVAGSAAAYFDPTDSTDMSRTIGALLADAARRAALVEAGRERLAAFSWEASARRMMEVYDDICAAS
jgi:glycosyltransferase involved in cell wall biosynthesis